MFGKIKQTEKNLYRKTPSSIFTDETQNESKTKLEKMFSEFKLSTTKFLKMKQTKKKSKNKKLAI